MRKGSWLAAGAGLGVLTGLVVVAVAYLGDQALGLPFIPFTLFEWLTRVLPGRLIILSIDSMVGLIVGLGLGPIDVVAKAMEQLIGIVVWLAASAAVGLALAAWLRHRAATGRLHGGTGWWAGAVAGLCLALLVVIAMLGLGRLAANQPGTLLWVAVLLAGWGAVLGVLLERLGAEETPLAVAETGTVAPMARRDFLLRAGAGSLILAVVAGGLGWLLAEGKAGTTASGPLEESGAQGAAGATPPASAAALTPEAAAPIAATVPLPPTPAGRSAPAPGTRPEVTSNTDFYRIDIDLSPPQIAGSSWQMSVSGLFDHPRSLTLQDLLAMPAVTQPITQSCISNPIGGDLISSTYYTGVRLRDLLQELGLQPAARQLFLRSTDGFYESVEMQDMQDPRTLLVYGMNGVALPIEHGYPLRIYIPNRYGMKQPKWIISMEAIDHNATGYWVDRGWSQEARPQVISIIDTVGKDSAASGRAPVGGIAWAGDRGIQSVEVQVGDGAWAPAELITPPLGPLIWVLWRYEWPVTPGRHTFRVRATDGTGASQNGQDQGTFPDGATGYHTVSASF
jgi:DMSO/TMAO reductase YedYZ molybdopterin-dependent catalytic subunit